MLINFKIKKSSVFFFSFLTILSTFLMFHLSFPLAIQNPFKICETAAAADVNCRPRLDSLTILLTMNFHSSDCTRWDRSFGDWRRRHECRLFRRMYNIYENLEVHILYGSQWCRSQTEFLHQIASSCQHSEI